MLIAAHTAAAIPAIIAAPWIFTAAIGIPARRAARKEGKLT